MEARISKGKRNINFCVLSVKYNPRAPDIRKMIKKHLAIIKDDEVAKEILPASAIRVSYKRNANLKELLAPSNPYKSNIRPKKMVQVALSVRPMQTLRLL
jgi:hypothetical protein